MKKILISLTIVISCLGISRVNAKTYDMIHSDTAEIACDFYVTDYDYLIELGYEEKVQELYNLIIKKYNDEYSAIYPYFFIRLSAKSHSNCNIISSFDKVDYISMNLLMYSEYPVHYYDSPELPSTATYIRTSYDVSEATYELPSASINHGTAMSPHLFYDSLGIFNPFSYFISNFDYILNIERSYNITGNSNFTINPGDVIKPYFTVENAFQTNHAEINLNDYSYVALSLKNYNQDSFSTQVYVKGNYCLTPVYNYGMTERKDILTGSQVERCSPYYDNYTPVRTYILESDLKNHAIYYLKAYDTSKDNYVKVDTSIFDITYLTEENKDNPYVTIGGKTYPTIPYDELTDTAIKSEDEGYVSGAVEKFSFTDIFTAPLDFLMELWGTIATFFSLITNFISLLPPILQGFLYSSFMLAIVLGLIKILL